MGSCRVDTTALLTTMRVLCMVAPTHVLVTRHTSSKKGVRAAATAAHLCSFQTQPGSAYASVTLILCVSLGFLRADLQDTSSMQRWETLFGTTTATSDVIIPTGTTVVLHGCAQSNSTVNVRNIRVEPGATVGTRYVLQHTPSTGQGQMAYGLCTDVTLLAHLLYSSRNAKGHFSLQRNLVAFVVRLIRTPFCNVAAAGDRRLPAEPQPAKAQHQRHFPDGHPQLSHQVTDQRVHPWRHRHVRHLCTEDGQL